MTKLALKLPVLSVVMLTGVVVSVEPASVTVTGCIAAKLTPLMLTDDPMLALMGFKVIEGLTVKLT